MAWSYSGNPALSRKDEVRFLIGDTNSDSDEQMLTDEEIEYSLTLYPISSDTSTIIDHTRQPHMAALVCAEAIWSYFQRQADERLPPVTFEYAARAKNYKIKVDDLRRVVAMRGGLQPYVGGISVLVKESIYTDSDRVRPAFRVKEDDNINSTSANTEQNLLDIP